MSNLPLILIVEDEPSIRLFAGEVLAENGYATISAASADEGLAIMHNRPEIRAVLTDVFVPGTLDGLALVNEIRRRWPRMGIVVASGRLPAEAVSDDNLVFLSKPYQESDLLAAVALAHARHA